MRLGLKNPALYRLMFGDALSHTASGHRSMVAREAGLQAKAVLEEVILRGARSRAFRVSPEKPQDLAVATIAAWSAAHGLTVLVLNKLPLADLKVDDMIKRLLRVVIEGLRSPRQS